MVRTQLQIDDETFQALREAAYKQRRSMSAVVRDALREHLLSEKAQTAGDRHVFSFIGSGASGRHDISERHDEYLSEDIA